MMKGKGKAKENGNGSGKGKARGRVQLQRIENRASRQVSFSKRRTGLMKKAEELAVLCDADTAVLVFSAKGKLYEFAGPSSMEKIIERHQQFPEAERDANRISLGLKLPPKGSLCASTNSELLEIAQRSFDETNTALLSVKELGRIEKELGGAFRQDMSRKTQQMADMIAQLQQKGKELLDDIKSLKSIETTAAPKGPKRGKDYSSSGKDPASASNQGDCGFSSEQQPWMSPVPLALSLTLSIGTSQGGSSLHNAPNLNSYSLPKT